MNKNIENIRSVLYNSSTILNIEDLLKITKILKDAKPQDRPFIKEYLYQHRLYVPDFYSVEQSLFWVISEALKNMEYVYSNCVISRITTGDVLIGDNEVGLSFSSVDSFIYRNNKTAVPWRPWTTFELQNYVPAKNIIKCPKHQNHYGPRIKQMELNQSNHQTKIYGYPLNEYN